MKITELSLPQSKIEVKYILLDNGYRAVGAGGFADVYAKEGVDYVLKIFTSTDKAYIDFVKFVIANPNEHFPKFKRKLIKVTSKYYAIRMEYLNLLDDEWLAQTAVRYITIKCKKELTTVDKKNMYAYEDNMVRNFGSSFVQAINMLVDSGIFEKHDLDLHARNIMRRGRVPVIIDPVA